MNVVPLEIGTHPDQVVRVACYSVPAASRAAFEEAMRQSADLLRTLPGFRGHLVLEKSGGESRFELVSIAVWENQEAIEGAEARMREHRARLGIDLAAKLTEWGVVHERGNYVVPPRLQEPASPRAEHAPGRGRLGA